MGGDSDLEECYAPGRRSIRDVKRSGRLHEGLNKDVVSRDSVMFGNS